MAEQLNALTFRDWSDAQTLEQLAAYGSRAYTVTGQQEPERMMGAELSPSMFPLLGASPAVGRFFRDDDVVKGAAPVVVLSHALWQQRFAGSHAVLGTPSHGC